MGEHLLKSHNKTLLMYHIVATVKYRKSLLDLKVSDYLKQVCIDISERHEIIFLEIGTDLNHVHFLVQSVPIMSVSKIVQIIKGNLSKQIFSEFPDLKKQLWGGAFWTDGFYSNTVSQFGGEKVIMRYIQNQGKEDNKYKSNYNSIYKNQSESLFET
jgi:REP element-mobilizing transposase RayT